MKPIHYSENQPLRVWWVPQMPMKAFVVPIATLAEASRILDALADYDKFQFENRVKGDYANIGGLSVWDAELAQEDPNGDGWTDWVDDDTGMDFDEWREENADAYFPQIEEPLK